MSSCQCCTYPEYLSFTHNFDPIRSDPIVSDTYIIISYYILCLRFLLLLFCMFDGSTNSNSKDLKIPNVDVLKQG